MESDNNDLKLFFEFFSFSRFAPENLGHDFLGIKIEQIELNYGLLKREQEKSGKNSLKDTNNYVANEGLASFFPSLAKFMHRNGE